ncbi:hypothetical protein M9H77_21637 [Catharanthus roseus]|uniref:Uncharacterized protein n=1 Tax=Catharanthus roseus TaxID=4058 RepID=A0ACC0AP01_CATRO|nr:hypothetical protein M9H77_21637 [Catharanthus roseus]
MVTCENWQLFVHDGRHNHAIGVYNHGHTQTAKLTEEQLIQIEQFRKSYVPTRNVLQFFLEQNVSCTVSAQKIYNVIAKIKKNRMQGQNTVEEVLCLSAQWGYTILYRNCDDSNIKHLYFSNAMSTENQEDVNAHEPKMIKDEEVASLFINASWHKLLNEINEQEYLRILDVLKTKWQKQSYFLHYLFITWLNPLGHKFMRV